MILYVYTRPLYLISRVCLCVLSSFECFSFFYSRAERLSFHTTPFDFFTKRTEELRRKNVFSASSSIVVGFVVLETRACKSWNRTKDMDQHHPYLGKAQWDAITASLQPNGALGGVHVYIHAHICACGRAPVTVATSSTLLRATAACRRTWCCRSRRAW